MKKSLFVGLMILSNMIFAQNSTKESIIKSLIGTHDLNSISAFMGANTMVNYDKSKGVWKGFMSMIMMGRRDGEKIKITPDLLRKLNTMKIIVNEDLSMTLTCNNSTLVNVPFKADGMVLNIKEAFNDESQYGLDKIKPELTFSEGELFLYAQDALDENENLSYDIAEVGPNSMVISYSLKDRTLKVLLCVKEGGGAADYFFKKKVVTNK